MAALVVLMLSACGAGNDAPTVSNKTPFVGEKFTISGTVDAVGNLVAANDRAVWENFGGRYHAKAATYSGELAFLRNWYKERYAWMNRQLMKAPPPLP